MISFLGLEKLSDRQVSVQTRFCFTQILLYVKNTGDTTYKELALPGYQNTLSNTDRMEEIQDILIKQRCKNNELE
jgi:hypothetical protein